VNYDCLEGINKFKIFRLFLQLIYFLKKLFNWREVDEVENRKCDRENMQITVRIYQDDTFIAAAKTQDVTKGGMFINTDVLLFPKNSQIDVVFESPVGKSIKRHCYPATVVRRCWKGIGVRLGIEKDLSKKLQKEVLQVVG